MDKTSYEQNNKNNC